MLYFDFNYDTSIVLNATFFLVYESCTLMQHQLFCIIREYFKRKERDGSLLHHMLIQSPQVVSAKEENTKLKHIKAAAEVVKSSQFGGIFRSNLTYKDSTTEVSTTQLFNQR